MKLRFKPLKALFIGAITSALLLPGLSQSTSPPVNQAVDIQEWAVPWESTRPRDPYLAPDGQIWFVGQGGDYAARFNPETKKFQRYE